jgi:azurin
MVTAFDISYRLDEGYNAFYLCEILKVCEAIILTLNLTQKKPPIVMSHSQIFSLLAEKYNISKDIMYGALLLIN